MRRDSMPSITAVAKEFVAACESGKGWEGFPVGP